MQTKVPRINEAIKQIGKEKAKEYFIRRYRNPENIHEYASLFYNHITSKSPSFHLEILEQITQGGRQAIAAPRGFAKSTLINIFGLSWFALNSKYHFIPLISDTYTQAKLHLGGLKHELESNRVLNFLYGPIRGDTWGEDTIVVKGIDGDVMIKALGAGMKIRGLKFRQYRPELAVIDDLENTDMVYSSERRMKLERWFNYDFMNALAKPKNVIYLGTILHYNALLKKIIDKKGQYRGWKTNQYQALTNGESIWPDRYPTEYLKAMRDNPDHKDYVGSLVFAQEYQNEPQDDQDRIIKLEWIEDYNFNHKLQQIEGVHTMERRKKFLDSLQVVIGVDPAIEEGEENDFTAAYVMGFEEDSGNEYMLDLLHGRYSIDKQVDMIVDLCEKWEADILGVESNAYQAGLYQLIKKKMQQEGFHKTSIKKIKTDKDKIRRARIHSSAFEGGYVKLRAGHPKYDKIKKELEEFPLGEFDDAFDSLMLAREAREKKKARAYTTKPKGF